MKKKIFIVLCIIIILRIVNIVFLNDDPLFYLSPRNFNGRGLLLTPGWIDFLIPLLIIFTFWSKGKKINFEFNKILKPLLVAFLIILTPVITGLLLNNYIQKSFIAFEYNTSFILKYFAIS